METKQSPGTKVRFSCSMTCPRSYDKNDGEISIHQGEKGVVINHPQCDEGEVAVRLEKSSEGDWVIVKSSYLY